MIKIMAAISLPFILSFNVASAQNALRVDVDSAYTQPIPIAVTALQGDAKVVVSGGSMADFGKRISQVVTADLVRSGLFKSIDRRAFLAKKIDVLRPNFKDWRAVGAQDLVAGLVQLQENGRMKVEFRLWDVFGGNRIKGLRYQSLPKDWRRVAHRIADAVYERLTGEKGYFDTRIVYIAESGPYTKRIKRLAIMDQDGQNHKFLTSGKNLVLTPRFSPTIQEITYLAYVNDTPRVYLYNLDSGKQEILGDFDGMTFAPRFSADGQKVIMSMAKKGNSDIYVMELKTRRVTRLTRHSAIDTSASYAPDGKKIVFNSDRGGAQQIYVMNSDGTNIKRISFGKGRYGTPVWSPRGDLIAFTRQYGGAFYIGVMRPDGTGERLLTKSFLDEGPTWSPNGRVLMFFRKQPYDKNGKGGETQLWSIDLTGYNERQIYTPRDASDPAWSPLLR
jgi:TolB protein